MQEILNKRNIKSLAEALKKYREETSELTKQNADLNRIITNMTLDIQRIKSDVNIVKSMSLGSGSTSVN